MTLLQSKPRAPGKLSMRLAAMLLVAAVLSSCSSEPSKPDSTFDPDAPLLIGTPTTFESVNELVASGSAFNSWVLRQMFLWLADESLAPGATASFSPRLAESWSFSEDGRTLTFNLRTDVTWSDGVPVTAADVRFTWQAQTSPDVAWNYADFKEGIRDVEVVDDSTVRFHFEQAGSINMFTAVEGGILPAHVWSKLPFEEWRSRPEWFLENLVVNGPYTLEDWQPRQRLTLTRNPEHVDPELPHIGRIVFVNIEEPAARLARLRAGEIDVVYGVDPADRDVLENSEQLRLHAYPSRNFNLVFWNTERPWFGDASVRRALALAVARDEMVRTLWGDLAKPHESIISSWHWAHSGREPLPHDPDAARRLLDEAGWEVGEDGVRSKDGTRFSFELTTNPGDEVRWSAMQLIAEDLAEVGVEVQTRRIEFQRLNAMNFAHDFDATLTALSMDTSLEAGYLLHSEAIDGGFNFGSYRNPEMEEPIEAIRRLVDIEVDRQEARAQVAEIERLLQEEQPMLILWEPMQLLAAKADVEIVTDVLMPFAQLHRWRWSRAEER